jgi:deoxyhypusine synthase
MNVKDLQWKKDMTVKELVKQYGQTGYQSVQLAKASEVFIKMKKNSAKTYLTFTSNMVSCGLRGFFAQLIELGIANLTRKELIGLVTFSLKMRVI